MKVTEQLPDTRAHVVELKEPAGPVSVNVTVPVGVVTVPGEVSVTVAVHEEAWFTTTGLVQTTAVEVLRLFTVTLDAALVLVACVESPPYAPVIRAVPVAVAVKVTEQLPETKAHVVELNDPAGPVSVKVTVPVGVVAVPGEASATVAVQDDACPTTTGLVQTTVVDVARRLTVTLAATLVLVLWVVSPPYAPVIRAVPVAVAVKVTEQLPDTRAQVVELKEPAGPVSVKVTVPVGVMIVPGEVSLTVAVQDDA